MDVHVLAQRAELAGGHGVVLAVIAAGGGLGALARYGVGTLLPTVPGHFPWGTFAVNVLGCFLIGVLMVLLSEVWPPRRLPYRLARPFLGVGVLGGFTTFSTYANEIRGLLRPGSVVAGLLYLFGTLLCALLAVLVAVAATRAVGERLR